MKALLIDPETQTIEAIDVNDYEDIVGIIGLDTIAIDEIGTTGDRLFFDEECFLRGSAGRFQIDRLIPVAGKGVVLGANDDGSQLRDTTLSQEELAARTKFL